MTESISLKELADEMRELNGVSHVLIEPKANGGWRVIAIGSNKSLDWDGWIQFDVVELLQELEPNNIDIWCESNRPVVVATFGIERVEL